MIKDFIHFSFQSAKNRQLRSWLTIIGIVIGIAAIIGLITVSSGLEEAITDQFDKIGTNRLIVLPKNSNILSLGQELTTKDADVTESMSEFKWVTPYLFHSAVIEFNKEKHFLQTTSTPIDNEKYSAIIGYKFSKDLFDKKIRLNSHILINGVKFKIIGIMEEVGDPESDNMIHIPMDTARELFNKQAEVSIIEL